MTSVLGQCSPVHTLIEHRLLASMLIIMWRSHPLTFKVARVFRSPDTEYAVQLSLARKQPPRLSKAQVSADSERCMYSCYSDMILMAGDSPFAWLEATLHPCKSFRTIEYARWLRIVRGKGGVQLWR